MMNELHLRRLSDDIEELGVIMDTEDLAKKSWREIIGSNIYELLICYDSKVEEIQERGLS